MPDVINNQNFMPAVIDRFEGKTAVIKTEDGQEWQWPIKNLPDDCEAGTALRIIISTSQSDQQEREKIAKTILNQLLKREGDDNKNKQK